MKKIALTSLLIFITSLSYSQKIKFKNDKVLADDKELFKTERTGVFGANGFIFIPLNSNKPLFSLIANNGGTHMHLDDDYTQIKFLTIGQKAEIRGGNLKEAIKLLLKNEIIKDDGTLDEAKIDLFIKNYDENISERTVITR
ncbi:hypothetical protein [Flavobacterium inviolabile]|uniref:hypothetical protein n=2 Tax=Flavobacterium TaxID=237 RepID=UPI0015B233FD|nr:hypothetical protein [Flavobacterium inviolabile]